MKAFVASVSEAARAKLHDSTSKDQALSRLAGGIETRGELQNRHFAISQKLLQDFFATLAIQHRGDHQLLGDFVRKSLGAKSFSPAHMIMPNFVTMEMALTSDRLILPMTESSGGIWIMETVDQ